MQKKSHLGLKIGVIGIGMVGSQVLRYFEEVKGYRREKNLFAYDVDLSKNYRDDVAKADIIFLCVPTPRISDGSLDISTISEALARLNSSISSPGQKIIILKSTVPPGTTEFLQNKYPQFKFLFNPEFLTASQAWADFLNPDRQIVAPTKAAREFASDILSLLPIGMFQSPSMLSTYEHFYGTATEAELSKLFGNSYGATRVAFGNIWADICEGLQTFFKEEGIDGEVRYDYVKRMVGADKRIGPYWFDVFHGGYRGIGGMCLPKDFSGLMAFLKNLIKRLQKGKGKAPAKLILQLQKALKVYEVIWDYNKTLLANQGLTIEDVTRPPNKPLKNPSANVTKREKRLKSLNFHDSALKIQAKTA